MRVSPPLRSLLAVAVLLSVFGFATVRVADGLWTSRVAAAPIVVRVTPVPTPAPPRASSPARARREAAVARTITRSRCFGAGAVDPARPCQDVRLRTAVVPTPDRAAAAQRGEPCRRRQDDGLLRVCFWGTPVGRATRTVALVGDSHASHWRAALQDVVRANGWRAISISRAGCPLTLARPRLPSRGRTLGCMRWNRAVQGWMARHQQISVVFAGAHRGSVVPRPGRSVRATRRLGYTRAWQRLLRSGVRQIVVFRDTPRMTSTALACVQQAAQAGVDAGAACALPRRFALPADPLAEAAVAAHDPRIQVADLSAEFCGPRVCPPVIGGALVLRDVSHMTTTFSATLGPALERTVDRLAASWR